MVNFIGKTDPPSRMLAGLACGIGKIAFIARTDPPSRRLTVLASGG
jgi:hypothetical protein